MLDQLAHRYGTLPSKVLTQGDSFDITVMDVAFTYKKYLEQKHDKDSSMDTALFDQEQLQAAQDRLKQRSK